MRRYAIDAPTLVHLWPEGLAIDRARQVVAPNWTRSAATVATVAQVTDLLAPV